MFNGWGALRFFDISDPANPVLLSTFATPNTNNVDVALDGIWSVHNPEWLGKKVYASWYSDGIRVLDEGSDLAGRGRLLDGSRRPGGRAARQHLERGPAPRPPCASDRNYGLYILKLGR